MPTYAANHILNVDPGAILGTFSRQRFTRLTDTRSIDAVLRGGVRVVS